MSKHALETVRDKLRDLLNEVEAALKPAGDGVHTNDTGNEGPPPPPTKQP